MKGPFSPSRRQFLRTAAGAWAAAAAHTALGAAGLPTSADPSVPEGLDPIIPADKKLSAEWVRSLTARGERKVLRGRDLDFVGMPVGGLTAGQLYLGGDGRLWHWDLFNRPISTGSMNHYAQPPRPDSPVRQGFSLRLGDRSWPLDRTGFPDVSFRGEYPIAVVEYRDAASPVAVSLEAFSPFVPLNVDDSSLPATVLRFSVENLSGASVEFTLTGELENAVCLYSPWAAARRRNQIVAGDHFTFLECSAESGEAAYAPPTPDVVFEDWSGSAVSKWTSGRTHLSPEFKVGKPFINIDSGGGTPPDGTVVRLVVDGRTVRTSKVIPSAPPRFGSLEVGAFAGRNARLEIAPAGEAKWPVPGLGRISFSDGPTSSGPLGELSDFGTMGLALLGPPAEAASGEGSAGLTESLVGRLGRTGLLAPGETVAVTFVLTWHFPNFSLGQLGRAGRHYASRFSSARAVASHVAGNVDRLREQTRLWRDTWYDSTLPYWLLDRTMATTSLLATSTSLRFANGRFWGWEGVGSGAGTCTHVWGYAQAVGRLFPELERDLRERTDFGLALDAAGRVGFRGETSSLQSPDGWAVDGQSMVILRTLREHQMSPDGAFLRRVWPGAKKALGALMSRDANADGILDGAQHNTLDSQWFGEIAWLSGLYAAALRAGEEMAREVGDEAFATRCRERFARSREKIVRDLFNGEYFVNKVDPAHLDAINSGTGCHIDQVLGQSWAFQVGLGRILPAAETRAALAALWRHNFAPDVGPYRAANKPGRWFAMPGEAGLLMCTFPRPDWSFAQARGHNPKSAFAGYFNECMSGFEYQVAGHMLWEGMVREGLSVARAVHDRYDASRRNPWNEVEFGDHYARSMAGYGVFLAACGFDHHGPDGRLGFAPRLTPDDFRAPFTSAEGWGTFSQKRGPGSLSAAVALKWGRLRLHQLSLQPAAAAAKVSATLDGRILPASLRTDSDRALIVFPDSPVLTAGRRLQVELT